MSDLPKRIWKHLKYAPQNLFSVASRTNINLSNNNTYNTKSLSVELSKKTMDNNTDNLNDIRVLNRSSDSDLQNNDNLMDVNASQASLASTAALVDGKKKSELTPTKIITLAILFTLNLLNYLDRFTVAG
jgi:hypothetical protein